MQDAKEEVRSRLNIEDVIGEYVQLKRAGRNFKGLSPFSGEKTPSFVVSPDKQIWHDFSSGRGGDVFSFVMEAEGMEFREALEHLARKAGVDLSVFENSGNRDLARRKKRLLEANALAARYYQQSLLQNRHALEYVVKKRGLSRQIIQDFQIGYAPESGTALTQFLTKKGFKRQELDEAGLLNRFGSDLFRGRMMISLMDPSGQVIGFTARIIKDDPKAPKYLNTPQTLLYDKSRHVFGLSQAKEAIRKNDYSVIVEGNMDVISSHQAGVTGVVATAGTALTEQHLKALSRLSHHVRLAFDGDKAGLAASERSIEVAQKVGVDLTMISLSDDAKDPDELIQLGVDKWQAAIEATEPVVDWILRQYQSRQDLTTAPGKRAYTTAALSIVAKLEDSVEQDHYVKKIAQLTDTSPAAVATKLAKISKGEVDEPTAPKKAVRTDRSATEMSADRDVYQDDLLAVALTDRATHELFKDYSSDIFTGSERQTIAGYIIGDKLRDLGNVPKELQELGAYGKIVILAEERYESWSEQDRYMMAAQLLRKVENEYKKKSKLHLNDQLKQAEDAGDSQLAASLLQQIIQLNKEIK